MEEINYIISITNVHDILQYGVIALAPVIVKYLVKKIKDFTDGINSKFEKLEKLQTEHIKFYTEYIQRKDEVDDKLENLIKAVHNLNDEFADYKEANLAILKDRLTQSLCYYIKLGHTTLDAKRNIEELYRVYAEFGGNGVVKELYEQYKLLPIDDLK